MVYFFAYLPIFAINIAFYESRGIENLYKAPINNINRTALAFWQKVSIAWIKAEIAVEKNKERYKSSLNIC